MEFQINDWVQHARTQYKGTVLDTVGDYVRVQWFTYSSGKVLANYTDKELVPKYLLKVLPPEPRIFSYDELVIAFMTEDEDWYYEVLALKGEKVD